MGQRSFILTIKDIVKITGRSHSSSAKLLRSIKKDTGKKFVSHIAFCKYTGVEIELVEAVLVS